jgi:hypothetical protein
VGLEVGDPGAVLASRAVAAGVVEDRLEAVVVGADDVRVDVDDDATHGLAGGGAVERGLVAVEREPFFAGDGRRQLLEMLAAPAETARTREREVVGGPGVLEA